MVITFKALGQNGRLGNQMFQYATLRSVGVKKNFEVKIPKGNYSLKKLNINSNIITDRELSSIKKKYGERFFHYDGGVFNISDWTDLFGYYQSYKYFHNIKEDLQKEFINSEYLNRAIDFISGINLVKVSVHVRRTDYLRFPKVHPFPGLNYYRRCFKLFNNRFKCIFIVCSDDIKWCKDNFTKEFNNFSFIFSEYNDEIFDLMLMLSCDHNISANSSFSWWGAYLNKNNDKIVIVPKMWLGPNGPQDYYDLIPKVWQVI